MKTQKELLIALAEYQKELEADPEKSKAFLQKVGLLDENGEYTEWGANVVTAMQKFPDHIHSSIKK